MSDLDFVIQRLQSELENRGLNVQKNKDKPLIAINNYFEESKEKDPILSDMKMPLKSNINNIPKLNIYQYEINQMKNQIEKDINQYLDQLKYDMKKSLDQLNSKMFCLEKELLKINMFNNNIREITRKKASCPGNILISGLVR